MNEIFLTKEELETLKMARNGDIACGCVVANFKKKKTIAQKIKSLFKKEKPEEPESNEHKIAIENLAAHGLLLYKETKRENDPVISMIFKNLEITRIDHIYSITDKGIEFLSNIGEDPKIVRLNVKKD